MTLPLVLPPTPKRTSTTEAQDRHVRLRDEHRFYLRHGGASAVLPHRILRRLTGRGA